MLDPRVWMGVQRLLDDYVDIRTGDVAVILYTSDSQEAAIWVSAALELRGVDARRAWMAPLQDEDFPGRLASILPAPSEVSRRLVVLTFERDTMSHTRALEQALVPFEPARRAMFRTISASASFFTEALSVSPPDLSARNAAVLSRFMGASRLRIRTDGGTDIVVGLDNLKHRWISNRGVARPGGVVILPAGEVATYPAMVSGKFVADFAFNVNAITNQDARLAAHPVTVTIEDGRAVKYHCADPVMTKFLDDCFLTHCAHNVGELGFGTNWGVIDAVAMNSHINERRPGVHLGFGQHNQDPGVVGYQCPIHLDLIARGGQVWVDDDPVPMDLENLAPSDSPHPSHPRDEDVFSPQQGAFEADDCCGLVTADGLQLCHPRPQ